jgi:hypothetical protein
MSQRQVYDFLKENQGSFFSSKQLERYLGIRANTIARAACKLVRGKTIDIKYMRQNEQKPRYGLR